MATKTPAQLLKEKRSTLPPDKLAELKRLMPQEWAEMEADLHVNKWLSKFVCDEEKYPVLKLLKSTVRTLSDVDDPVLILGPTGTGKEILANALHGERGDLVEDAYNEKLDPRHMKPKNFKAINCAGLPETLVESILFGHKAGSFTGSNAREDKIGVLQAAWNGTVFLDEVGELSLATQAKLLRALQEKAIHRVGGENEEPIEIKCRIIAATHRDIPERVKAGVFREDLFWRLSTFELRTLPLEAHALDIALIVKYLIIKDREDSNFEIEDIEEFCAPLIRHAAKLSGNVRQLEQIVRRYHVLGIKPSFE